MSGYRTWEGCVWPEEACNRAKHKVMFGNGPRGFAFGHAGLGMHQKPTA